MPKAQVLNAFEEALQQAILVDLDADVVKLIAEDLWFSDVVKAYAEHTRDRISHSEYARLDKASIEFLLTIVEKRVTEEND